ncbi:hypothetical protein ANN_08653 [Periplaneta americana]|uniref:Uncharacterized protein n=1 Tax=Periplaneta americana TaxID=6978 RepID=A0ABQ8T3M2_PERAM|nr:hypothetical protein ANN_08653 [Periplaneta americana]
MQRRVRMEFNEMHQCDSQVLVCKISLKTKELFRISIRTIPEYHEYPPVPQEKEKSSKGFSSLLENLFGKWLVRQNFQNRVSIAFRSVLNGKVLFPD